MMIMIIIPGGMRQLSEVSLAEMKRVRLRPPRVGRVGSRAPTSKRRA